MLKRLTKDLKELQHNPIDDIYNPIDLFLPSTLLFGAFVLFSSATRLLNLWFITYFIAKIEIDLSHILVD